jgi:hypothetical protein
MAIIVGQSWRRIIRRAISMAVGELGMARCLGTGTLGSSFYEATRHMFMNIEQEVLCTNELVI